MKKFLLLFGVLSLFLAAGAHAQWMRGPGYGGGMMSGVWESPPPGDSQQMTMDEAEDSVRRYLKSYWNADLIPAEIMEFDNHFYAEVEEKSTDIHAFELLINKWTGAITPEPGPNMMWNTKYGHMGTGMMGGGMMGSPSWGWGGRRGSRDWDDSNKDMSVSPEAARQYALQFLDARIPGTTAAEEVDTFYGYYTIHVLKDGQVYGMLGVNGYTGWVWYHEWHGKFLRMKHSEEK